MSRVASAFAAARKEGRAAFIPYITAGDPSLDQTAELVRVLVAAGADLIELGVPFSDPIADGPTNQRAAERALANGTRLTDVLTLIRTIRQGPAPAATVPIVLFTYANPILQLGIDAFAEQAAAAGVDGLLLTDVPSEEMTRFVRPLKRAKVAPIMLITPTSTRERIKAASKIGRGFLYFVSRTGVTGARPELASALGEQVRQARKLTRLPVAVGFGISTPDQVRQVAAIADGVVVGSAIVDQINRLGSSEQLAQGIHQLVAPLAAACQR